MKTYGARIFDRTSGRFVFTAPGVASPDRVGEVTAGAFAVLTRRDGLVAAELELHSFVDDGAHVRPMDADDEAAMNAAFRRSAGDLPSADPQWPLSQPAPTPTRSPPRTSPG